ncbi:hypothetical protein SAMN05216337_105125 [Bradyrhizobium brasilense]|uniref:DUF6894 domain-containing protein n=1 Tax=Bradyrhizobium brasilense TaxID=1419277 RepID=A0A1G7K3X2_9BRAD|nr:hypothetical protein [Bradyrhizobium brasilense]SDF31822.1 hypothetical protein SAMN05216337_105125 [Bradyrhizobium brasilense]
MSPKLAFANWEMNWARLVPRYYFDLKDSKGTAIDEDGTVLRDLDAAQNEAARTLGGMAGDSVATVSGSGAEQMEIVVRDNDGAVMTVRFCFEISRKKVS